MSQPPQYAPPPHQQVYVQPSPTNGLGLAGFITSLAALLTCGLLSPIGLLISFFGLFKRPRGFAIAGTILGLLGTVFMAVVGFAMVMGFFGIRSAVEEITNEFESHAAGHKAALVIIEERTRTGTLPSDEAGTALIKSHVDAWGRPMRYKRSGMTFSLTSDGADGQAGTDDDIEWDESELRFDPTTQPSGEELDEALEDPDATDGAGETVE